MTKAKTIDRLELTRRHSRLLETRGEERQKEIPQDKRKGDICPRCLQHTLIHIEGCERCSACGYDACAWGEV